GAVDGVTEAARLRCPAATSCGIHPEYPANSKSSRDLSGRWTDPSPGTASLVGEAATEDRRSSTSPAFQSHRLWRRVRTQALGMSASRLLPESEPIDDLLGRAWECGAVSGSGVFRRGDGGTIETAFELRRYRDVEMHGYTLVATDVAPRRERDAYRDAAVHAQRALQRAADETKEQLTALESLIDPAVNPLDGLAAIEELLERLRATIGADGAALVQDGRGARATAVGGL